MELTFDDADPLTVALDALVGDAGRAGVSFPRGRCDRLAVEITQVDQPTASRNGVGFSEVGFGDTCGRARPSGSRSTWPARWASAANGHRLDVVMSGPLRPADRRARTRSARCTGGSCCPTRGRSGSPAPRVEPNAADDVIDRVLGTVRAGRDLRGVEPPPQGVADAHTSRAFDGDVATAWTATFGPQDGQWVTST